MHVTDRTSIRGILWPSVRSIVAPDGRQSWGATIDRTINRGNRGAETIVASCDRSYGQSLYYRSAIIHNWWCHHARLVVRSRKTHLRQLTIWNRRLEVLNMTIDLVTTDFALTLSHDLCDQSYVLSATWPRFSYFSLASRSQTRRKPRVCWVLEVLNMTTTFLRLILSWRSSTTSATSRAFVLRFSHVSEEKRS